MAAPPDVYAILAVSTTKNPFGPESGTWTITPAFPVLKKTHVNRLLFSS
jgi:hypothetical protein